jgi:hypothetical protein
MTTSNLGDKFLHTSRAVLGWSRRLLALGLLFGALLLVFLMLVQPWYQRWGATDEELGAPLPEDAIAIAATSQDTRAITIDRPIDRVWPWLAQLGQDRGGFYSFDLLENLVGCQMPIEDVLRPDRQTWTVGDRLWMYPPEKAGGIGFAVLREYDPGHALAFGTHVPGVSASIDSGSWTFVLRKIDPWSTRLIVRSRAESRPTLWGRAFDRLIFSPAHFVMERRTMIGLKEVAEEGSRSRLANHLQVVLWTLTLVMLGIAKLLVLTTEHWVRALKVVLSAAVLFAYLTLEQPPWFVGAVLVAALMVWTRNVARPPQAHVASLGDLWTSHTGTTDTPARSA